MNGDKDYFDSYDDLEVHRLMLCDSPRTESYRDAILKNQDFFAGKVVMDVGAGSGILSLFCKQAGAKKVYAVEASPLAKILKDVIRVNQAEDVIEVLHQKVEDVELSEKVDIIVSEWMGFYLLHESMLDSVLTARDMHLKEDGLMLPSHAQIYAAPCSLTQLKKSSVDYWSDVYGFNMSPFAKEAMKRTKPEITIIAADQIISEPIQVLDLDLKYTDHSELDFIHSKTFISVNKTDKFQGLALWFKTDFFNYTEDKWTNISLNTSPQFPPTHWKQTIVPLFHENEENDSVEEDDIIGWELKLFRKEDSRQYSIQVEVLDPAEAEHPVPCGCQSAKCTLISALLQKEDEEFQ